MKQRSELLKWLLVALISLWCINGLLSQHSVPGKHWLQYADVTEAGFSEETLERIVSRFDSSQAATLLVIYRGKVLLSKGDVTRRFMTHSIRKSYMNALYGVYINNGQLDLTNNLQSLGIDDVSSLTDEEKKATIGDLLSARSGIYLPAAYSPKSMAKNLPARGSHAPGTYWYYNNWDFNVLSTILEQQIGNQVFEVFYQKLAQPLGMEDFRLMDGHYRYEPEISQHPAYLFKMSARDMARFGLLYLNQGKWNNQQLIPADWVRKSTSTISKDLGAFGKRGGYGYLWWVSDDFYGHRMFYASGSGGHRIVVFPEDDLVVVHQVNTYLGKNVANQQLMLLLKDILEAKIGEGIANPSVINFASEPNRPKLQVDLKEDVASKYFGKYKHPFLGNFIIRQGKTGLELATNVGKFRLFAIDENHFFAEDLETVMEMQPAPDEAQKFIVKPIFAPDRSLLKAVFYY